ncbi:neuropeptide FF receptor 1-like [Daphnia pulex]|uniref:neuropeptide FF receptor 1-like n=1 Tax=Daphnia pulex TaxID=6669 RepID=UPI001EDD4517|nr:neuropeptide FF receptor 1-like [Daphnia pulex]
MSLVNSVDTQQSSSMDYPLDFLSENGTDWPELSTPPTSWYRYNVWVSGALCTAYGLVFCAGLIGNLLVAVVVLRGSRTMRRCVTNLFLVNLAFADLLVVLACLPFTLVAHLIYRK